jgi:RHS repeat-associated protein
LGGYCTGSGTTWGHTNVFAGGALLATYTNQTNGNDTVFALTDWQGTKRAENGTSGCITGWSSMPYGNSGTNPGATTLSIDGGVGCAVDATEHHYTSKIHDSETGNDDFGARYFANTAARWLSPDWAAAAEAVPYASYGSPQTLNLYAFVGNNPLSAVDPDGHSANRVVSVDGDPGATDFSMMMGGNSMGVSAQSGDPDDGPGSHRAEEAAFGSGEGTNGSDRVDFDKRDAVAEAEAAVDWAGVERKFGIIAADGDGDPPKHNEPHPSKPRDCTAEAKAAAVDVVKSNFNEDFVGITGTTVGGMALRGASKAVIASSVVEGAVYTATWVGFKASVAGSMTGFACSLNQIQEGLNFALTTGNPSSHQ